MKLSIILWALLLWQIGFAQTNNYWEIKGRVLDEKQNSVEFANVYANNTSLHTVSNEKGEFRLKIPNTIPKINLIISFTGFKTFKQDIAAVNHTDLTVRLRSNMLEEVKVVAKRDKSFKHKWRIFESGLLGESEFTRSCKILNADVIHLQYDEDKNVVASAEEPFYIQNNALGYKMTLQMSLFISNGIETYFTIDKFFEKLQPASEEQKILWETNRKKAYQNSFRSFLVSLSHNNVQEACFVIFKTNHLNRKFIANNNTIGKEIAYQNISKCDLEDIFFYDETNEEYVLHSDKPLMIFLTDIPDYQNIYLDYPYKYATVVLPNSSMSFTKNGWILKPNRVSLHDYWGNEGFSVLLPDDYGTESE